MDFSMRSARSVFLLLAIVASLLLAAAPHARAERPAQPAASPTADADADARRLAEAKSHFLRGVDHADRGEWDAALAEFLASREILPTAKNTYNAAVCLRQVKRFDEALEMYETLLRDFPNAEDRKVAERELAQLKSAIGAIELRGGAPGAAVSIDGRERGVLPLSEPVRVGAGTHTVRVTRNGFLPFEASVDVVGMKTVPLEIRLVAITAGGRLHVAEQTGKTLDVVVDGAVVGTTPWDGVLPPGDHSVLLRGGDGAGTQPVLASVKLNQTVTLNLLAEQLDGSLRVRATPQTASVSIDGVPVGRGTWEGRLRSGRHSITIDADGHLPYSREFDLEKDAPESIVATLARDPDAFGAPSASLALEIDVAGSAAALFGGDINASCSEACSAGLPLGARAAAHGIYQAASGFGFGVDVGYLVSFQTLTGRAEAVQHHNLPTKNDGTVDDKLRLSGLTAGGSAQYRRGDRWPVLLRIGAGVLLGSVSDDRAGTFTNLKGERYTVDLQKSAAATYLYVAPELRVGRRFGTHLELSIGAEIMVMAALAQPKWQDATRIRTTDDPRAQGDGLGTFGADSLAGSLLVYVMPGLGARYDF